ncbi:MAG: TIGR02996 domain-containing protein [Kofleriaceae bacterium]
MDAKPLIDAIVADPDDEATWLVCADWLLERGDSRGELIRLAPATETDNAAKWRISQIENDEERLFSPALAAHARQWRVDWHRGFIRHAELMNETRDDVVASTLPALCGDPHVGLLSALTINLFDDWEYEIDQITGRERERRRRRRYTIGDVGLELPRLTRLSNLTLRGVAVQPLTHDGIESLSLDANGLAGDFSLPQLESLSVEFSSGAVDHWPFIATPTIKAPVTFSGCTCSYRCCRGGRFHRAAAAR